MTPAFVLALLFAAAPTTAHASGVGAAVTDSARTEVRLLDVAAIRRLYRVLARRSAEDRAAGWSEFSMLAGAVLGEAPGPVVFEDLSREGADPGGPLVRARPGVGARDRAAYRLLALGYSAREAADVVSGRISQRALDMARRMIAVGQGREEAADYLDTQYRLVVARRQAAVRPAVPRGASGPFDALIERYAQHHRVEPAIVRAIMATESAFNPAARSPKGAVGLMQLMPATARELGVNPLVPEQNIEGGVRYFAQMLRQFGSLELALVAYNAGPGFAERYARGQAALYGETRDYVRRVLGHLRAGR